ncbi:hypothetical protein R3P38DRAFT_2790693 [Favolaschia claudopus]|uniref:Uncharacterized protein n=1 Tax=Favolaschia claudopus TaxID=2862362 RepID=A0AAW0AJC0_9AGAR
MERGSETNNDQIYQNNPNLRSYQLWKEILKSHPEPAFSQKAVYNLCAKQNQSEWRRTENELESAKILLAEFTKDSSGGCIALAFALPPLIRKWAGTIGKSRLILRIINTTKAGYECFALLGEVFGSGLPVGFIRRFIDHWSLEIIQSLSDKDITGINALLAELPDDIKHQDRLQVAQCFLPTIKLRFQGQTAENSAPSRPKIVINAGNRSNNTPHTLEDVSDLSSSSDTALEQLVDSLDDKEEYNEDLSAIHFCEHPLLPDRSGNLRTAKQIRDAGCLLNVHVLQAAWTPRDLGLYVDGMVLSGEVQDHGSCQPT